MSPNWPRGSGRPRGSGFTVVELIVVLAIIAIVLSLAVPALNRMTSEARFASAVQSINGQLNRTYFAAVSDRNRTALRFAPGAWVVDPDASPQPAPPRQHAVTYRYNLSTDPADESGATAEVQFRERFVRREDSAVLELPPDVWVAPGQALLRPTTPAAAEPTTQYSDQRHVLNGTIGEFRREFCNADFLDADDFVIQFDPSNGVVPTRKPLTSSSAICPELASEDDPAAPGVERIVLEDAYVEDTDHAHSTHMATLSRRYFDSLVIYPREMMTGLGVDATPQDRQGILRRFGRLYYLSNTGILTEASRETQ